MIRSQHTATELNQKITNGALSISSGSTRPHLLWICPCPIVPLLRQAISDCVSAAYNGFDCLEHFLDLCVLHGQGGTQPLARPRSHGQRVARELLPLVLSSNVAEPVHHEWCRIGLDHAVHSLQHSLEVLA